MTSQSIEKLGIIAGGGTLPILLLKACQTSEIQAFGVGFDAQTTDAFFEACEHHKKAKLGQVGKIIKYFKSHGVSDLVMIGSIERPSFSELIPDLKAAKFIASTGLKAMGDSDLLSALRGFLESEGFSIHAVHDFVPDLLSPAGAITKVEPSKDDWIDIKRGVEGVKGLGGLDIGQAAIIQDGLVLGVEAIEGTTQLIERCAPLKRKGRKGVLVKLCKPQQDTALDLPTIGFDTMVRLNDVGFGGIAIHAGKSLLADRDALVSFADKHKLYIIGIDPDALPCDK